MTRVSQPLDRVEVIFDDENLVANAGLILPATLADRLELEALIDDTVRLVGRVGGARPGRKVLTLVHSILAGGSHIDHADVLRAGATAAVLGHRVMAPSTLGTFLRSFTFGHVRQLEAVNGHALERAWAAGAGPGDATLVIDIDSTICEVAGHRKQGAAFGYTKVLGYHPILATRADTGEILHARMRKGSANTQRGARRFIDELIARTRRAGATGQLTMRMDSGFWSKHTITTLNRLDVRYTMAVRCGVQGCRGGDRADRRQRLDRHRLPRRRAGAGRRDRPTRPAGTPCVSSCAAPGSPAAPSSGCGPTGGTTRSSPTSPATPSTSTGSTVNTPSSSSRSAT